ncbi:MAG: Hsp20/alpha crystallin family protein [Bacteroidota bacterium]
MNLVFNNPRYNVNRVLVDELLNNFFKNDYSENYLNSCGEKPATNIFETEKELKVEIMLPGFTKKDVHLNYQKNRLTIKVEKENEENSVEYKYARREFEAYNFEKQYRVPKTVEVEKISANFKNGVLTVTLPKKEEEVEKAPVEIKVS